MIWNMSLIWRKTQSNNREQVPEGQFCGRWRTLSHHLPPHAVSLWLRQGSHLPPAAVQQQRKRAPLELGNGENKAAFHHWGYCVGSVSWSPPRPGLGRNWVQFCDSLNHWLTDGQISEGCHLWKNKPELCKVRGRAAVTAAGLTHGGISRLMLTIMFGDLN